MPKCRKSSRAVDREARLLAKIRHEQIARVLDHFVHKETPTWYWSTSKAKTSETMCQKGKLEEEMVGVAPDKWLKSSIICTI